MPSKLAWYSVLYLNGFDRGRLTCLYEFTHLLSSNMDSKLQVDAIYTDLSKEVDRVHHCILLNKLKYYGLCESLLLLFKSPLTDRVGATWAVAFYRTPI